MKRASVLNSSINMAAENMKMGRNHLEGILFNSSNQNAQRMRLVRAAAFRAAKQRSVVSLS